MCGAFLTPLLWTEHASTSPQPRVMFGHMYMYRRIMPLSINLSVYILTVLINMQKLLEYCSSGGMHSASLNNSVLMKKKFLILSLSSFTCIHVHRWLQARAYQLGLSPGRPYCL